VRSPRRAHSPLPQSVAIEEPLFLRQIASACAARFGSLTRLHFPGLWIQSFVTSSSMSLPHDMMKHMNWLLKEEPANYAFDALMKDKRTVMERRENPVAQKHLHAVRGRPPFYYHTGTKNRWWESPRR